MQYIYKGINIEWEVKSNLKKNKNYSQLIEDLKPYKTIQFTNCGYGELPFLAAMVLKEAQIYASETDEEKLLIAQNCANMPANLHYEEENEIIFDRIVDLESINY